MHKNSKKVALWAVGGIIVIIMGIFSVLAVFGKENIAVVDFDDIVPDSMIRDDTLKDNRPTLRVAIAAMISPETTRDYYNDLLHLIGDRMGYRTIFLQKRTYAEVNVLLEHREVDVAFVCSGPYVTGHNKFGMELLAAPVVHGQMVYYSYLLAKPNSGIKSLDDLKGKRFAFTDPHSNTGCLVPRYMLTTRDETSESFFSETIFTGSHDNSIKAVAEGLVDGAAVDSLIWEFMSATDPTYTAQTVIIEKSPPYGIPPVVTHPQLDPQVKRRLRETLLNLHKDKEAALLLHKLQIEKFGQPANAMYDSVRKMQDWLTEKEVNSQ